MYLKGHHLLIKRTIVSTIILLFLTLSLLGQDTIYFDSDWIKVKKEQASFFRTITPYKSKYQIEDYFISGQIQMKGFSLQKDSLIKDGYFEHYTSDGKIEMKLNYKENSLDGPYELFYDNGVLKEKGNYKNDILTGHNTQYFQNGELKREAEFVNGKYNGLMVYYNDKGIKIGEGNCVDDGWDGKWKKYFNNGDSVSELFYGKNLFIEDIRIKISSNQHIWQLIVSEENKEYKRFELKCIAPINNRKNILANPPTFSVIVSKTNDGLEKFYKKFQEKKPLNLIVSDSEIQLIEAYQYNFVSNSNTENELLVLRLRKDNTIFLIEYIAKETDSSNNKNIVIELIKSIGSY